MLWSKAVGAGGTLGGGGGASAIYRGGTRSNYEIVDYPIDMGTPDVGEIQVLAFVYQSTTIRQPTCADSSLTRIFSPGRFNSYDWVDFYTLDSSVTGTTTFSGFAFYRTSLFVWSVRGAALPLTDTGYNNEGTDIDTLTVSDGGVVLAASTGEATFDVYPDIVDTNDDPVALVENTFYTSAGSTSNASAQTLDMRVTGDTASRSVVAAVSFGPA